VAWKSIDKAIWNKSDMFQIWHAKQCIGVCTTRSRMAHIQDILDSKCPICKQEQEKSHHLNRCPDQGRTLLFRENVASLVDWMHEHNRTDAELAYWIEKYLVFCGTRTLSHLVQEQGSNQIKDAAASQDEIGWVEVLRGKVLVATAKIQEIHCKVSDCQITGDNWMKHFIGRLLRISHLEWLYRNFTLHDKTRGYLRLQRRKEVLKEVDQLLDTNPDDIPKESQYLMELDFTSLYSASFEKQSYWVLAMKAARRAGRRANHQAKSKGASHRRRQAKACNQRAVYDFCRDLALMNHELRLGPQPCRRPHHSSSDILNPLNKRRKPD
jgi:hypothetical protein